MMQAPQFISRHPFAVQPERLPSGAMTESGRSYPSDDEQPKQNMLAISQRTSDLRSVSLPARKRSPDSPAAESNAMAATAAGSAPLPAVTPFLEDFNGVSHEASSTNYSPRTKTCLYKVCLLCSEKTCEITYVPTAGKRLKVAAWYCRPRSAAAGRKQGSVDMAASANLHTVQKS